MFEALLLIANLAYKEPVDPACSYPEGLLTQALQEEPRPNTIIEGEKIKGFFANMAANGWMVQVHKIDKIVIVDAKKTDPSAKDNVWVYFLFEGCIMDREPMAKDIVEELLK